MREALIVFLSESFQFAIQGCPGNAAGPGGFVHIAIEEIQQRFETF